MASSLTLLAVMSQVATTSPQIVIASNLIPNVTQSVYIPEPGFAKDTHALVSIDQYLTRQQAQYVCANEYDGHLVRLNTQEEEVSVLSFMEEHNVSHHFWIALQWKEGITNKDTINTSLLWNDGQCTPNSDRDNYRFRWSSIYDLENTKYARTYPCFIAHKSSNSSLTWEPTRCLRATTMCDRQTHDWQEINVKLSAIAQTENTSANCQDLCHRLKDCFMTSPISYGCVVALASENGHTSVITEGKNAVTDTVNIKYEQVVEDSPTSCKSDEQPKIIQPLEDYAVLVSHSQCSYRTVTKTETKIKTVTEYLDVQETNVAGVTNIVTQTVTEYIASKTVTETVTEPADKQSTRAVDHTSLTANLSSDVSQTTQSASQGDLTSSMPPLPTPVTPSLTTCLPVIEVNASRAPPVPVDKKELILDASKLSKTIRAKVSATNKEASSKVIGYSMALPFLVLFVLVVLTDIYTRLLVDLRYKMAVNVREWLRP